MKRFSLILCLLGITLAFFTLVSAQEANQLQLTVAKAVEMTLANNPVGSQAQAAGRASLARSEQKESLLYPVFNAELKYTHLDPDPFVQFPGIGSIQFFPVDNYDYHISAYYPLFNFGKIGSQVEAAHWGYKIAQNNTLLTKQALAYNTITTYYSLVLLNQSIAVQQQQLNSLAEHLTVAQKRKDSGSATDFDVLTTKVKVAEADDLMSDLQNSRSQALIHFQQLIGLPGETEVSLDEILQMPYQEFDEAALLAQALSSRLEYQNASAAVESARSVLNAANGQNLPELGVSAVYGEKNGYFPDMTKLQDNTVGMASLSMPLLSGVVDGQVKEAQANLDAAQAGQQDMQEIILAEVRQSLSDVQSQKNKIEAAKLHLQLASEALEQAKLRYSSGVITNLDLLTIETLLEQAQLMYLHAQYNYVISRINLKKASGEKLY